MNKSQLVEAVAQKADISKVKAGLVVQAVVDSVLEALTSGQRVTLIGFGTFSATKRAARVGRNPRTGKVINIAATTTPKFKAGKALKDACVKIKKKK